MEFWDMATLVSFWSFFRDRIADLSLIDFKLGLYIKVNVNKGQNKYEVNISKNVAKMAILWPKIGQRHFGARPSHGHNLAIFHPILTNEHTKMTNSLRRIEWNKKLSSISLLFIYWFLALFLLRGLTWAFLYVWTQNYPQVVGTCPGHHGQLMSQNCVLTKIRAEPPPPPPLTPPPNTVNIVYQIPSLARLKIGQLVNKALILDPGLPPFSAAVWFTGQLTHHNVFLVLLVECSSLGAFGVNYTSQCIPSTTSRMQLLRGVWGELLYMISQLQ